jgi:tetratricopeptide (TPR) repeat protein
MLKINLILLGLLSSFCLVSVAESADIKTNLDGDFSRLLLAQFDQTANQRQQAEYNRQSNDYQSYLYHQEQLRKQQQNNAIFLASLSELRKKGDYVGLGNLLYSRGYMDMAFDIFNKAINTNPRSSGGYFGRAIIRRDRKDFAGALADFDRSIEIDPNNNAGSYYNRALVKKDIGNGSGAIQDFRRAAQFYRSAGNLESLQQSIGHLQRLGATE